jgi:hypothetical protein
MECCLSFIGDYSISTRRGRTVLRYRTAFRTSNYYPRAIASHFNGTSFEKRYNILSSDFYPIIFLDDGVVDNDSTNGVNTVKSSAWKAPPHR